MTRDQAKQIARILKKKRATAYCGRYQMCVLLDVSLSTITEASAQKIMRELWQLIADTNYRPAIEVMYAEEQLKRGNTRKVSKNKG